MLPFCPIPFPRRRGVSPSNRGFAQIQESLLCFSSPAPACRFCPTSSPPPSPFFFSVLPSYAGIFIVLPNVQGLLLVFSQCSVRIVASIDVFLMHQWREMNSTSTYSFSILNLSLLLIFERKYILSGGFKSLIAFWILCNNNYCRTLSQNIIKMEVVK